MDLLYIDSYPVTPWGQTPTSKTQTYIYACVCVRALCLVCYAGKEVTAPALVVMG